MTEVMEQPQHEKKRDPRHERMLEALSRGMTWGEAAKFVGVGRTTLYRWCWADPELSEKAHEAGDAADDMVEAATYLNCMDLDPAHNTLRMFWLKSRRKKVYGDTIKQTHEFANLSDDELVAETTSALAGVPEAGPEGSDPAAQAAPDLGTLPGQPASQGDRV